VVLFIATIPGYIIIAAHGKLIVVVVVFGTGAHGRGARASATRATVSMRVGGGRREDRGVVELG
jgi:hypothetical protein